MGLKKAVRKGRTTEDVFVIIADMFPKRMPSSISKDWLVRTGVAR